MQIFVFKSADAKISCNDTGNDNSSMASGGNETKVFDVMEPQDNKKQKKTILDLYSGCGAMSSGLSIGAFLSEENIVTVMN